MALLTIAELAVHLAVSVRHLERCAAVGMPAVPVGARAKRYDAAACQAWLAEHHSELATCPSKRPRRAATTSVSASAVNALTAAYRRAHLRAVPSDSNPS